MSTLYMKVSEEKVSKYVIFSGDPWRVNVFEQLLDQPEKIAFSREYNTITGYYKGVKVTATSTGIGAPSAVIAMEEMYECGMEVAIRMGTVMSLDDNLVGDFLIPLGSMRGESTSDHYVDKSYPAIADFELVKYLNAAVAEKGYKYHNGIHSTIDAYYIDMKESKFSKENGITPDKTMEKFADLNIKGVDMESSAMLTVGSLMGVKTAVITLATVSQNLRNYLDKDKRMKLEKDLCEITLEAIYKLNQDKNNKFGGKI